MLEKRPTHFWLPFLRRVHTERRKEHQPTPNKNYYGQLLVFSAAGLDALIKQLIRDALPKVIDKSDGARVAFVDFIQRQLMREPKDAMRILADTIATPSPRSSLISRYIYSLCDESLQSADQVFRIAACFDVPTRVICPDPKQLKEIFSARNQIIHEMDIDFNPKNRSRRARKRDNLEAQTQELLALGERFVKEVDSRLA